MIYPTFTPFFINISNHCAMDHELDIAMFNDLIGDSRVHV
jgi:hypothetical protein